MRSGSFHLRSAVAASVVAVMVSSCALGPSGPSSSFPTTPAPGGGAGSFKLYQGLLQY